MVSDGSSTLRAHWSAGFLSELIGCQVSRTSRMSCFSGPRSSIVSPGRLPAPPSAQSNRPGNYPRRCRGGANAPRLVEAPLVRGKTPGSPEVPSSRRASLSRRSKCQGTPNGDGGCWPAACGACRKSPANRLRDGAADSGRRDRAESGDSGLGPGARTGVDFPPRPERRRAVGQLLSFGSSARP